MEIFMGTNVSLLGKLKSMPREYWILSLSMYLFFVSWAGCYSLLAIWLQRFFNLSGSQTGFTYAVFSVTAFLLQPVYGLIQDKLVLRRNLIFYIGILMALCGPYYIFVCEPLLRLNLTLGGVAVGVYMGFAYQAGVGALESYSERFSRRAGFEFGHVRMWGSMGWASTVAVTGILININPHYNFYLSTVAGLLFLGCVYTLRSGKFSLSQVDANTDGQKQKVTLKEALSLTKLPAFWALVVYVVGCSTYLVYDQQFMVRFVSLFEDKEHGTELYGYLNSTQVFLEFACTFLAPFVVNKIGAKNGMLLASTIMFVRILLSGLVESALAISAVKLLHAPEVPLVIISLFKYITTRFNPALSATLYLVGYQMITQVIGAVMAPIAGYGYDTIGFAHTYIIMSLLVLVTTVLSFVLLKSMTVKEEHQINEAMAQANTK